MRILRIVAAVLLLVIWGGVPSAAQGDSLQARETLKGVKVLQVLVGDLGPDFKRDRLTTSQLQTDISLRLRQAGIRTAGQAATRLYVTASAGSVTSGRTATGHAYAISVEFIQPVTILQTSQFFADATTWSTTALGTVDRARFSQAVRRSVRDCVDKFINAFLAVNPTS
jgi:hypothetical protein